MFETGDELTAMQASLDASIANAGTHLADIFDDARQPTAAHVCAEMTGMCLLTVATATADGRPISAPLDGYVLHGSLWVSSSPDSVRIRHLRARPAASATYLPSERFAVIVHGRAELMDLHCAAATELRQAMIEHYVPLQGESFSALLDELDATAVRIDADKVFAFALSD